MSLTLSNLLAMARFTVQRPREGARLVMQANLPMPARWAALALTAIISALLAHVSLSLMPAAARESMADAIMSPFATALVQGVVMVVSVFVIHSFGRRFRGTGTFEDALILVVWLQFILLILQVIQIVVQVIVPPLADLIGTLSVVVFLWLLSHFIAELHGFRSVFLVFLGVILSLIGIGLLMAGLLLPFISQGV